MKKLWKPAGLILLGMGVLCAPWVLLWVLLWGVRQPDVGYGEIYVSTLFYFMVFCSIFFAYLAVRGTRFRIVVLGRGIEIDDTEEEDGNIEGSEKASTPVSLRR